MPRTFLFILFAFLTQLLFPQERSLQHFLADSSLLHASVSVCIKNADNGEVIIEFDSGKSLAPASVNKLITTAAALELLGPQYNFRTVIGYTGKIEKQSGKLSGNIIIKGGGDPALGSDYFSIHYQDFIEKWVEEIKKAGISSIDGKVLADDSYYDFLPLPSKWLWEDMGNYYGAGVYGLSVFDNTFKIHLKTGAEGTSPIITGISPEEYSFNFENRLTVKGTTDEGYVFASPYSRYGWLEGSVPASREDFILKGSIADPPELIAKILTRRLKSAGVSISEVPSTIRSENKIINEEIIPVTETISPPLSEIINVLNHESVNLYAEHLLKELGRTRKSSGSTVAGLDVIKDFLHTAGIKTDGMFIEDGSGLSPLTAINTGELVNMLIYMKNHGKYFKEYFSSLPEAGKEGTLRYVFNDPVFEMRLNAKSGSMTRVRSYAGYLITKSERNMAFAIIINNYTGPSHKVISGIEDILREIILYR